MCDSGQCHIPKGSQGDNVVSTRNNKRTNVKITHSLQLLDRKPMLCGSARLGGQWL